MKKALCREAGPDRDWLAKVRHGGDTTITSTSAFTAGGSPQCKPQSPPSRAMVAGMNSLPVLGCRSVSCAVVGARKAKQPLTLADLPKSTAGPSDGGGVSGVLLGTLAVRVHRAAGDRAVWA